jgi:hypothetical protein
VDGGGAGVRGGQLQGGGVGRRGGCGAGGRRGGGRLRGLHKALHAAFKRGDTSVEVRVRGGKELQACVVPHHPGGGGVRKQYVLRSLHDPNYLLGFVDRLESECHILRGTVNCSVSPRGLKNR